MDEGILVSNSFISNVEVPEDESTHSTEIVLLKIKSWEHPTELVNLYRRVDVGSYAGKEKSLIAKIFFGDVEM